MLSQDSLWAFELLTNMFYKFSMDLPCCKNTINDESLRCQLGELFCIKANDLCLHNLYLVPCPEMALQDRYGNCIPFLLLDRFFYNKIGCSHF